MTKINYKNFIELNWIVRYTIFIKGSKRFVFNVQTFLFKFFSLGNFFYKTRLNEPN